MLVLLDELPSHETSHMADVIMEGLVNLSPRRVQELLENTSSIKVKRLFLFFADRHRHSWVKGLNLDRVDLGKGKRVLAKGGKLDPKYQITVPETLYKDNPDGLKKYLPRPGHAVGEDTALGGDGKVFCI